MTTCSECGSSTTTGGPLDEEWSCACPACGEIGANGWFRRLQTPGLDQLPTTVLAQLDALTQRSPTAIADWLEVGDEA